MLTARRYLPHLADGCPLPRNPNAQCGLRRGVHVPGYLPDHRGHHVFCFGEHSMSHRLLTVYAIHTRMNANMNVNTVRRNRLPLLRRLQPLFRADQLPGNGHHRVLHGPDHGRAEPGFPPGHRHVHVDVVRDQRDLHGGGAAQHVDDHGHVLLPGDRVHPARERVHAGQRVAAGGGELARVCGCFLCL